MKVVINACYGGFSLSKKAVLWLAKHGCAAAQKEKAEMDALVDKYGGQSRGQVDEPPETYFGKSHAYEWEHADDYSWHPLLVECVETIGAGHRSGASGPYANLRVVEIPEGVDYEISEYDGIEHIAEKHRTWS
jgi:hypothetical protein